MYCCPSARTYRAKCERVCVRDGHRLILCNIPPPDLLIKMFFEGVGSDWQHVTTGRTTEVFCPPPLLRKTGGELIRERDTEDGEEDARLERNVCLPGSFVLSL